MTAPALRSITAQDANSEPLEDRTFPAPQAAPAFPRRVYAISVLSPSGFPVTITLNDMKLDQLDDALNTLLDRGYMPAEVPSVLGPNAPAPATAAPAAQATGVAPFCPIHTERQMKTSNFGGWFCTFGDPATGDKCKAKAK